LEKVKVYYRMSDGGYAKEKPDYIDNRKCLDNFLRNFMELKNTDKCFTEDIIIIADNVSDETYEWVKDKNLNVERTTLGSGAQSFNYVLKKVLDFNRNYVVYLVEDDYLHLKNARKILLEGIKMGADYVSLYDHPDKYINGNQGGNPYVENGGEMTQVFKSDSCHWKLTNSTTMTFASTVDNMKRDKEILQKWTTGTYPEDFKMFLDLRENGRSLITPLPGYSTHGETKWLSPFTDWSKV